MAAGGRTGFEANYSVNRCIAFFFAALLWMGGDPPASSQTIAKTKVWTGVGADARWETAENWSGGSVPQRNEDVVLDPTASKDCLITQPVTVRMLVVAPGYLGTFRVQAPLTVTSNILLSGKIELSGDSNINIVVYGNSLDFLGVEQFRTRFGSGAIILAASNGVQRLIAPKEASVVIPEIRKIGGGLLELSNHLNAVALSNDSSSEIDFSAARVKVQLLQIRGPVRELAGTEITVTGFGSQLENGFGSDHASVLDLAPAKPWKLIVKARDALAGTNAHPFVIRNATIGNLDASGGDEIRAEKYIDGGGNKNVKFIAGSGLNLPVAETEVQRNSRKATVRDIWGTWDMIWQRPLSGVVPDSLFFAPFQRFEFARDSYVRVLASNKPIDAAAVKVWESAPKSALFLFEEPGILRIRRAEKDQDFIFTSVVTNDFVQPLRVGAPLLVTGDLLLSYLTPEKKLYLQRYLRRVK